MRSNDTIKKLIADLKANPSADLDARVHRAIDQALMEKQTNQPGSFMPNLGSIIMKALLTRWAATAAVIMTLAAGIFIVNKSVPSAFGIEQVIAAYNNVRFLHVKTFGVKAEQPNEFWIQSDETGKVAKARYHLPVTDDGEKLITWTPQKSEIWFKTKRGFLTFQTKRIEGWMQSLMDQSQPQLLMKKLQEDKKTGKIEVNIQNPKDLKKPALVTVLHKGEPRKEIYVIDQKTDLITRVEYYNIEAGIDVLQSTTEFSDYNVPIDEKMFSLRGELPKDVRIGDTLNQVCGVAQGTMTDEEAAAETVRQFFQALIDKDYKAAGLIMHGQFEEYTKAEFGKITVKSIISIGPAVEQTNWMKRGYKVPCELEIIQSDGAKSTWKPGPYVRPGDDETRPDRWNITGGVNATEAELKLLPDNEKYQKLTPKEAAEAFFKACSEKNWDEFIKFWPLPVSDERTERSKEFLGGLEVISIGEPYQDGKYSGWYVPYEIRTPSVEIRVQVSNTNAAKRYVIKGIYDCKLRPQLELKWTQEPAVLTNNEAYQKMTPVQVVKAYYDASIKEDWTELRKFTTEADVEQTKRQCEQMKKHGVNLADVMPFVEPGAAAWSPEHQAVIVKCRMPGNVKKWNLAVRNDNSAHRFMFDGGL